MLKCLSSHTSPIHLTLPTNSIQFETYKQRKREKYTMFGFWIRNKALNGNTFPSYIFFYLVLYSNKDFFSSHEYIFVPLLQAATCQLHCMLKANPRSKSHLRSSKFAKKETQDFFGDFPSKTKGWCHCDFVVQLGDAKITLKESESTGGCKYSKRKEKSER